MGDATAVRDGAARGARRFRYRRSLATRCDAVTISVFYNSDGGRFTTAGFAVA